MSGVGVINYIPTLLGHLEAGRVPQAAAWLHSLPSAERTALARAMDAENERALSEALRSRDLKKLERILGKVSARIRADRFADGPPPAVSLRGVLEEKKPEVVAYRARMAKEPVLRGWLNLTLPLQKIVDENAEVFLTGEYHVALEALNGLKIFLDRKPENKLKDLLLIALRKDLRSPQDIKLIFYLLGKLKEEGYLEEEAYKKFTRALAHLNLIAVERSRYETEGKFTYTISIWAREEEVVKALGLSPKILDDLSLQVIVLKNPDGKIVGGMVLRLFQSAEDGRMRIFASFVNGMDGHYQNYSARVKERVRQMAFEFATQLGIPLFVDPHYRIDRLTWSTQSPFFPVTAPLGVEEVIRDMRKRVPHPFPDAGGLMTYEAMRTNPEAKVYLNPWLGNPLPPLIELVAGREIEPDPKVDRVKEYLWAIPIGPEDPLEGAGRSVDYFLGKEGVTTPDGTRWHHLSSIGVGPTNWARAGRERRDGRLPLEEAWRRFYLTNLMHTVAGPFGFRTSLGVSVTDFQRIRGRGRRRSGISQTEGKTDELSREHWRLSNLETDIKTAEKKIDRAKAKVAKELGLEEMTREQYVRWLARTSGEQFAIMMFFSFDHGDVDGEPQLGPRNVSLLGEIRDLGSAKISPKSQRRYYDNEGVAENHVDMKHIKDMENRWRSGSEKDRSAKNWLEVLLAVAPDVKFGEEMIAAFVAKNDELMQSGIDPKQAIRDFNRRVWGPFIKQKRSPSP